MRKEQPISNFKNSKAEAGILVTILTLLGIAPLLYLLNPDYFFWYTVEDGIVEYFTATLLAGIALVFFTKGKRLYGRNRSLAYFYFFLVLVFIFGVGEEVSWGQRLLGFETPPDLKKVNAQGELNFHNIRVGNIKLNKLIFGTLLYAGLLVYFVLVPYLYKANSRINALLNRLEAPLPKIKYSILYLSIFVLLHMLPSGKLWEVQELALAGFLFLSFLFPAPRRVLSNAPLHNALLKDS